MRTANIACYLVVFSFSTSVLSAEGTYPNRPMRLIVPFAAGGNTDIVGRAVADGLSQTLQQTVIVDNRGGGGGVVGVQLAARSSPDGYTLLMGTAGTHAINVSLFKKLPYDPVKDFIAVSLVAKAPLILVASPSLPVRSLPDFIDKLKNSKKPQVYGSSGLGTASHLAMELLLAKVGAKASNVAYRGNAQAIPDLLTGQVPFMFMTSLSAVPLVQAGKLRPLGVTSLSRLSIAPDIPIIAGVIPGFDASPWYGIFVPSTTPRAIVTRLNQAIVEVVKARRITKMIEDQGGEIVANSPAEFAGFVGAEIAKWNAAVVRSGAFKN